MPGGISRDQVSSRRAAICLSRSRGYRQLGSLRVTSRSRYGDGVEGCKGWMASGGHAAAEDSETLRQTSAITILRCLGRQGSDSSRPVLYTRATKTQAIEAIEPISH